MNALRAIRTLPQDVIDKIAAGEVIQRPKNVVKELLENSLDAGATQIQVFVKYAGTDISVISVKDNGHGIKKADLAVACERFATSKLETFDDLTRVATFGFRGEALASISHVAKVTITSKTDDSPVAYEVKYSGGLPLCSPKPIAASTHGTTITVEDLFYNNPVRKNALRNLSEEYRMISELVTLYALDNLHVNLTLKKNAADPDVRTRAGTDILTAIRSLFGSLRSKNLLEITYRSEKMKVHGTGVVGDLNSALKSYTFILFINKRLVECKAIRKAIEAIYKENLAKGNCSFIFLSLTLPPESLDVNIHPTKNELRLLYEDEIAEELARLVETKLSSETTAKIDLNKSFCKSPRTETENVPPKANTPAPTPKPTIAATPSPQTMSKRPSSMVRNAHESQRIDVMLKRQATAQLIGHNSHRRVVKLSSVLRLRQFVTQSICLELRKTFAESTYIGCAKNASTLMFIQHSTQLLCVDLARLSKELFYQVYLEDWSNFGYITFPEPLPLIELANLYVEKNGVRDGGDAEKIVTVLVDKAEMLDDYFAIRIENEAITAMPLLLDGYIPNMANLPTFLGVLALHICWYEEDACFHGVGQAFANFHVVTPPRTEEERANFDKIAECVLFPYMKKLFRPPVGLRSALRPVGSVPDFYKVFERC